MKAFQAATAANRISDCAILVGGGLCGVLVFTVALPLALSSPFPTPKHVDWAQPASSPVSAAASPATYSVASLQLPPKRTTEPHTIEPTPPPVETPSSRETEQPAETAYALAAAPPAEETSAVTITPTVETTSAVTRTAPGQTTSFEEKALPVVRVSFAERWSQTMYVPEVASTIQMPAEAARLETPERHAAPVPARRRDAGIMEEVDRYLWEVYQRQAVKSDSSGDFTWKDPAAAKHMGISMQDYVIRGMDADFREQLYHAGHAMDGNGINWSMLSAFRDDYRQNLASGFKAHGGNSKHGGSRATGGYGHGQAIDLTTADGDASAAWHWIDAHGAKYGLHRPIPGPDPAHVQPSSKWHEIAVALRAARTKLANQEAADTKTKVAGATR
jgi:hypothetical protein